MIGHFVDAIVRHVANRNSASLRRIEVHVVNTDTIANNDLRLLHARNDIGIHRGELRDDRIGIPHQLRQVGSSSLLFPGNDFVALRAKNSLLDIKARKRIVRDRDFHHTWSLDGFWKVRRSSSETARKPAQRLQRIELTEKKIV